MFATLQSRKAMRTYNIMNRTLGTSLSLASLFALGSCTAVQPKPQCKAQTGDYAAKYTLVDMAGTCDDKILTGETISVQYYGVGRDAASAKPKLGLLATRVAEALATGDEHGAEVTVDPVYTTETKDETGKVVMTYSSTASLGPFASVFPNDKDVCTIKDAGSASAKVADIPADMTAMPPTEEIPGIDLTYTWTNLNMLVTPTSNAVYFGANLELQDGDCKANYKVTAISPAVGCEGQMDTTEIDPMTMMPVVDPDTGETAQVGTGMPDPDACVPSDDNGLNVDIDYECDAHSFLCVPANDYPQKKSK
jgi:hypothetical protein